METIRTGGKRAGKTTAMRAATRSVSMPQLMPEVRILHVALAMGWNFAPAGWRPTQDPQQALWVAAQFKMVLCSCNTDDDGFNYSRAFAPDWHSAVAVRHDWHNTPIVALMRAICECAADIYTAQQEGSRDVDQLLSNTTFEE